VTDEWLIRKYFDISVPGGTQQSVLMFEPNISRRQV